MQKIRALWASRSGASAVEYALALAIIGTALALAVIVLSGAVGGSMNATGDCIAHHSTC
jgi:Flp pilus assembly pilin Flp